MGAVDYWCNLFTKDGFDRFWRGQPEINNVLQWWGRPLVDRTPEEFVQYMDESGVDIVMVPAAQMNSYMTNEMIWDIPEEDVAAVVDAAPGRIYGLVGVNPRHGMAGVRRLEDAVKSGRFIGALLHTYGFGIPVNHRRYYPFYAKCVELDVPVVMQVGHSAEAMPSEMGRPLLIDDIALDFPELRIVGAHTGWPWVTELTALAWKHPNVYIGTSAHNPRYWDPELVRFANSRGRGKVLFGTDYPVVEYPDGLAAIDQLGLRDDAKALLVGGAARKVFRLPDPPA